MTVLNLPPSWVFLMTVYWEQLAHHGLLWKIDLLTLLTFTHLQFLRRLLINFCNASSTYNDHGMNGDIYRYTYAGLGSAVATIYKSTLTLHVQGKFQQKWLADAYLPYPGELLIFNYPQLLICVIHYFTCFPHNLPLLQYKNLYSSVILWLMPLRLDRSNVFQTSRISSVVTCFWASSKHSEFSCPAYS